MNSQTLRFGRLRLSVKCDACRQPVPLRELSDSARCAHCGADAAVSTDVLSSIIRFLDEDRRAVPRGSKLPIPFTWAREIDGELVDADPTCGVCEAALDVQGPPGEITCPGCGTVSHVAPAPGWLRKTVKNVQAVCSVQPQALPEGRCVPLFVVYQGASRKQQRKVAQQARARKRSAERARQQAETAAAESIALQADGSTGVFLTLLGGMGGALALWLTRDVWGPGFAELVGVLRAPPFSLPAQSAGVLLASIGGFTGVFASFELLGRAQERALGRLRKAQVPGEVTRNLIVSEPNPGGGTGMRTARELTYTYEVDGERYTRRQTYRMLVSVRGAGYAPGQGVTVYYQPGIPHNSGLKPPARERAYGAALVFALALFLLVGGLPLALAP